MAQRLNQQILKERAKTEAAIKSCNDIIRKEKQGMYEIHKRLFQWHYIKYFKKCFIQMNWREMIDLNGHFTRITESFLFTSVLFCPALQASIVVCLPKNKPKCYSMVQTRRP